MSQNSIAEVLGIDPNVAAELPVRIGRDVFFQKLARHGIVPQTEEEAVNLLVASDRLEEKRAEFRAAAAAKSPVNRSLQLLLGKTASAPARAAQVQAQAEQVEIQQKTAGYLSDPLVYGALLSHYLD